MPPVHVLGMRFQVSSGFVKFVIEIQIEVMRLEVHDQKHRWHRAGKFTECIVYILGLNGHAIPELFIVYQGG